MLTKIPLLKMESGFVATRLAGITTITFLKGDLDVVGSSFSDRFREIVVLNPWLAGKLIKDKGKADIHLAYDNPFVSDKLFKQICFNDHNEISLNLNMKYVEILRAVYPVFVTSANLMINKPDLVSKLTLVKDFQSPKKSFSLVFSLSHSVGDGHTYYKLLNMITGNAEPEALSVARKYEADEDLIEAVGKKEFGYFHGAAHIGNALRGTLSPKKTSVFAYYVNDEKVAAAKAKADLAIPNTFLSANDIITSSFSNLVGSRITSMAINFRNKIKNILENDAGNYEGVLLYDSENYQKPEGIRKVLDDGPPYRGLTRKLPSFFRGIFCQMALITNWASFSKEAKIEGCEELLHLPLILGMPYDAAIIFRAQQQRLGIIFFTKKITATEFTNSKLPLGDLISKQIFQS